MQHQGIKDTKTAFESIADGLVREHVHALYGLIRFQFNRYVEWDATTSPKDIIENDYAPWVPFYVKMSPIQDRTVLSGLLAYEAPEIDFLANFRLVGCLFPAFKTDLL